MSEQTPKDNSDQWSVPPFMRRKGPMVIIAFVVAIAAACSSAKSSSGHRDNPEAVDVGVSLGDGAPGRRTKGRSRRDGETSPPLPVTQHGGGCRALRLTDQRSPSSLR